MPGASEDQPERLADLGADCYHRGAVVATETVGNRSWGGLMAFYWPRIYRFLDRSSIAYHLDDLPAEGQPGSLSLTSSRPPARVDMWFHPGLTSPPYPFRVLFGTLVHEGLHGIRFAVAREFSLSAEQTRRLVYSHSIGRVPPGYGERLQHLCAHVPWETGVELLTNKLLMQHGLEPLVRTSDGGYDLVR